MPGDSISEGVYYIVNKASGTMIDTPWMNNPNGKVVGWSLGLINPTLYDHQNWFISQEGQGNTFIIKNIGTGQVLQLMPYMRNGGIATCSTREMNQDVLRACQEWLLQERIDGWYTIQNSRIGTVLEIADGSRANRAIVQGWDYDPAKEEQLWRLERRSRTPSEIFNLLCNTPPFHPDGTGIQRVQLAAGPSGKPIEYITLLDGFRTKIFLEAGVLNQELAPRGSFRPLDFVEKIHEEIRTKGGQPIRIPGIAVLFGVVEGETMGEKRAYNWYLTQDLCSVEFLDARTGREYTARGLDLEGFRPTSVYY